MSHCDSSLVRSIGKEKLVVDDKLICFEYYFVLSFSVLIQFVGYRMPQLSNASDINIVSNDGKNTIYSETLAERGGMQGVERVFGRRSLFDVPAEIESGNQPAGAVDMISCDDFDLNCLAKDKMLKKGGDIAKVYGDSDCVLAVCDAFP